MYLLESMGNNMKVLVLIQLVFLLYLGEVTADWTAWVNGTCSTDCKQNRTRSCTSGTTCTGDYWQVIPCLSGSCAVEGFDLQSSNELLLPDNTLSQTYTVFEWTDASVVNGAVVIIDDVNITKTPSVDNTNDVGSFNITTSEVLSLNYGAYHVQLMATTDKGTHYEDMVLYYEAPICITGVDVKSSVLVDEVFNLTALFSSGSNIETEWMMNSEDSVYKMCYDIVQSCTASYSYNTTGYYNVTLITTNEASSEIKYGFFISVVRPISGFNISVVKSYITFSEQVELLVTAPSSDYDTMGNLTLFVDFGDGTNTSIYVNDHLSTMSTLGGYSISHDMVSPGDLTITSKIYSGADTFTLPPIDIIVWDNLTVLAVYVPTSGTPAQGIEFYFLDTPKFEFEFLLTYGDGNDHSNDPDPFYKPFTNRSWTHTYSTIGEYNITFSALNPGFSIFCTYKIAIQNPLVDMSLTPNQNENFPYPDGLIDFQVNQDVDADPPTNVTCMVYSDAGVFDKNITLDISYGQPYEFRIQYSTASQKAITLECSNLVSSKTLTATITIVTYDNTGYSDVVVTYPKTIPVNMSLNQNNELDPFAKTVHFTISLSNCVRLPRDVIIKFNFKDGSPIKSTNTFGIDHSFSSRGKFAVTANITSNTSPNYLLKQLPLQIGSIEFTVDQYVGPVGIIPFIFNITGPSTSGTYEVFSDNVVTYDRTSSSSPIYINHMFNTHGTFYPHIIATFSDFTEIVYLDKPIYADYNLSFINIEFNTTIDLPPGDITVTVYKHPLSNDLPNVICLFDFGDIIDTTIRTKTQDITESNPLTLDFTYITLGYHKANITCYNNYDRNENVTTMTVQNECFPLTGIFDRQYSNSSNPLKILMAEDLDLASRMPVKCADKDVEYVWKMYTEEKDTMEEYAYEPPVKPLGSIRFLKGKIPEGIYRITLNVSLPETYVYEPTYVQFIRSPPVVQIVGGYQRLAKQNQDSLVIDALKDSYELEMGYGGNQNMTFEWSCKSNYSAGGTLDDFSSMYQQHVDTFGDCTHLLNTSIGRGMVELTFLNSSWIGYAVTVNGSSGKLSSEFTQLILVVPGSPPIVFIECEMNCVTKYAISSKSIFRVTCSDCEADERLVYNWRLFYQSDQDYSYWHSTSLAYISSTGTSGPSLVIDENKLAMNYQYKLTVTVSGEGRTGEGFSAYFFLTNQPPYGGSCEADPPIGNASTTPFNVKCFNWKDEGTNFGRNETRDDAANLPLKYDFFMVERSDDKETLTPFQSGSEMTATELNFPVGNPDDDYSVYLRVHIYDSYGDYSLVDFNVSSIPPAEFVPSDANDVEATEKQFGNFEEESAKVKKGGNPIALMRLFLSTVSLYGDIELPEAKAPDIEDPVNCANYVDPEDTPSTVKDFLLQKTESLLSDVEERIPPEDSNAGLTPSDAAFITKTIGEIMKNKAMFTGKISKRVSKATMNLMKNIRKRLKRKKIPTQEAAGSKRAIKEVVRSVQSVLNYWKKSGPENLDEELTLDKVKKKFRRFYRNHPNKFTKDVEDNFDSLAEQCFQKRQAIRSKQRQLSEEAGGGDDVITSTDDALDSIAATTSPGEGESTIEEPDLTISIEKDSKDTFLNKSSLTRPGMSLQFENDSLTNITEGTNMELQVTVFDKTPILNATDGGPITGQVMNIAVKDDQNEKVHIPLKMKIRNHGVTHFKEYAPMIDPDDPDKMMYFKIEVEDNNVAILLYLRLDDALMEAIKARDLYTLYVKSNEKPSSTDYQFITTIKANDIERPFGFKVFIPEGTVLKGDAFVALKPMDGIGDESDSDEPHIVSRRRRSIDNDTISAAAGNETDLATVNVSLAVVTTGCRNYDPDTQTWTSNNCQVLSFSTLNDTACLCKPTAGGIFSLSFAAPNMIDFSAVWGKFDAKNAAVYATMIAILVLYFIFVVILRRYDKKDCVRCIPTFLCDNQSSDDYYYLIAVHTGLRRGSGTKSNVCFVLSGDMNDSGVRLLCDEDRQGFGTNTVKFFVMSATASFGELSYLRVWHDNSGEGNLASWYLHKIVVTDIQTDKKFIFHCDKWLALDMDDGMIDRILPVLGDTNCEFETAFSQQSRANVTENHLWLSLVIRPQKNSFSRVQRLSCILLLLFLAMITNAMFFQSEDDSQVSADGVQLGGIRLSMRTLWVSFVGAVITVPPILIVTFIFKNTSEKMNKKKREKSVVVDIEDETPNLEIYTKKKFPHWVVYVAWTIVGLAVVTSAFFLLLYSMQWGKSKAEEWLTTFVLSFVESIFLVDPFKVIILAVLIAVIMRKPVEDEKLTLNLDVVRKTAKKYHPSDNNQFIAFRMEVMSRGGPPAENMMKKERENLMKMKEAKRSFTLLIMHVFFAAVIFCISYVNRDQRAYLYKAHIDNMLFESSKYQYGFSKATTYEGVFNWATETLVPLYYPTSGYSGKSISVQDKFFIGDFANLRLGLIRMRQVRVKKAKCFTHELVQGHFCAKEYEEEVEEKDNLCTSCSTPLTTGAWKYVSSESIWGIPIKGVYNTYAGGGYIQNFDNTKDNTQNMLKELKNLRWLDRLTRALFVEFALYNANINVICYSIFLAEFPATGGGFTWVDSQCFRPTLLTSATGAFNLLLSIFFLILVIMRIVSVIKGLRREKCKFLCNFWNILDIVLIILSLIGVGVWTAKYIYTDRALELYRNDKETFVNFTHIVVWEYAFNVILGFLVFVATLRVSSALGYNQKITELAYVLKYGCGELLGFGVQFFIIFFAFVAFANLMFGLALFEYRSLFASLGSLLNTIIGRNTLKHMKEAVPIFAEMYFFIYVFFVVFTLLTMFAAILNNSITHVRSLNKDMEGPIGIFDVLSGTFKDMLGLVGFHVKNKKAQTRSGVYYENGGRGPISSSKILNLVKETFADSFDGKSMIKGPKEKLGGLSARDFLIRQQPTNHRQVDSRNICTPRQIHMEL